MDFEQPARPLRELGRCSQRPSLMTSLQNWLSLNETDGIIRAYLTAVAFVVQNTASRGGAVRGAKGASN